MNTKLFFMDEKYADKGAPRQAQVISLTGVLVPSESHRAFRERYYDLVFDVTGTRRHVVRQAPLVHASELLPELGDDDDRRVDFFRRTVQLVNELDLHVYRIGYHSTPKLLRTFNGPSGVVGLCFSSILHCLGHELERSMVWPVMETDRSDRQDKSFPGTIQSLDSIIAQLGLSSASIDNTNLGEVLYATKKSAYISVVDCVAYLLHLAFLKSICHEQTPFKLRLAEIADGLKSVVAVDEVIEFVFGQPPPDYVSDGPIRFGVTITPRD